MSCLIIIPTLNEIDHIEKLAKALIEHNTDLDYQLVIADGGSTDGTVEVLQKLEQEFSQVTYLHNPKKLQSAAINLAVEQFGKNREYLIRLDAHSGYPDDYCQKLLEDAKEQGADSVVTTMDTVGTGTFQKAVAAAQNSVLGNGGSSHRGTLESGQWVDHGHHALMRVSAFQDVGGYDETFSHNEDAELDKRLADKGYKIWLTIKTDCTYFPRSSIVKLFTQYRNYGQGRIRTILKHSMKPKPRQMVPAVVLPALIISLFSVFHPIFTLPISGWALICLCYGALLGVKAKDPVIFGLSGVAAMTMHVGWSIGFWTGLAKRGKS